MLNKKKMLVILIVIVFSLGLSACSGGQKQPDPGTGGQTTGSNQTGQQDKENVQLNVSVGDSEGKSAALPNSYPADLFPVYEGSYIESALEVEGSYTIVAFSKEDFKNVASFYKNVLNSATVTFETDSDEGFTSFGTIEGYSYNFDTGPSSEKDGYASSITIMLMPAK
ncbi:MAG: hypothetical protein KGZ63_08615 [Clostridiales bacterium]|jgi:uncharacterized membrane protein YfhO|nr:hypothetical protein [Clostridiales bacterium]